MRFSNPTDAAEVAEAATPNVAKRAARALWIALASAALAVLTPPAPALAVVIDTASGSENTAATSFGLPWAHVGKRNAYSAVYLGNRWVLTAAHVGAFPVRFGDVEYPPQPRSPQRILNPDGSPSDLIAFRLEAEPPLALMPISMNSPAPDARVWLVGQGHDRGPPATWLTEQGVALTGYEGRATRSMRWGTNRLEGPPTDIVMNAVTTRVLTTIFSPRSDPSRTRFEAQAAVGDSGGAMFVTENGHFALAGILILRAQEPNQPSNLTLYGNRTLAADLAYYRDQLIALVRPDCSDEIDNDDDGAIDFPSDSGCRGLFDNSESQQGRAVPSQPARQREEPSQR